MKKNRFILLLLLALMMGTSNIKAQDEFIGEIRLFPYNFAPLGWMECSGQILSIRQNTALFSILGTTYGGDGVSTYMLPNLQGKTPMMPGSVTNLSVTLGTTGGTESETMTAGQLPVHTHSATLATKVACSNVIGTTGTPGKYAVSASRGNKFNTTKNASSATVGLTTSGTGASQPRNNMQPYTTLMWCICVQGNFPMRD